MKKKRWVAPAYVGCLVLGILLICQVAVHWVFAEKTPQTVKMPPVYANAFDIERVVDPDQGLFVRYALKNLSAPGRLLEFYDIYFNKHGWQPSFETCQRQWMCPSPEDAEKPNSERSLFGAWFHPQHALKASLMIYLPPPDAADGEAVRVECRIWKHR